MNLRLLTDSANERQFNKGSWAILVLALLLVACWLLVVREALHKPIDGWAMTIVNTAGFHRPQFLGKGRDTSDLLQEGDVLLAIEGRPVETILQEAHIGQPQRPAHWQAGQVVRYTVLRNGQEMTLDVPLYQATLTGYFSSVIPTLLDLFVVVSVWLIGPVIFFLRPRHPVARLLFLFSVGLFVGLTTQAVSSSLSALFYRSLYWPAWLLYLIWQLLVIPTLIHLVLIFPVEKLFWQRHPYLSQAALYGLVPLVLGLNWLFYRQQVDVFLAVHNTFFTFQFISFLLLMTLAIAHSFITVREPVARAQLRWLGFGILGGIGCGSLLWFLGEVVLGSSAFSSLAALGFLLMPLCFSIAILRYRLFDIDILINRTLVYGALTAALALVYFGSVVLLQTLFRLLTGEGQSQLVTVLSTLAIAALFTPLRRRIQGVIDRRFYRRKYDAVRTLAAFGTAARDEVDLNQLTGRLLEAVEETMQPAHVSVWLRPAGAKGDSLNRR
jgi:hypothetical protein